jgi:hypothetical protein
MKKTYVEPTLKRAARLSQVTAGTNFSGKKGGGVEDDVAPPPPAAPPAQ